MSNLSNTAVILCDMWDLHWCRGATRRVAEMAPRMNELLEAMRAAGCRVVHCPSETIPSYEDTGCPARTRALAAQATLEEDSFWAEKIATLAPLGVDPDFIECDCGPVKCPKGQVWRRQIDTIRIDPSVDLMGDGEDVLRALKALGIRDVFIMGVHTNLCVLGRPFAIKAMRRYGFTPTLIADMTDCMAPSDEPPYVNHFDALQIVVDYIREHLADTTTSGKLLGDGITFSFAEDPKQGRFSEY